MSPAFLHIFVTGLLGLLFGLLLGLAPLVAGFRHDRPRDGVIALGLCALSGAAAGVFLAAPVAILALWRLSHRTGSNRPLDVSAASHELFR